MECNQKFINRIAQTFLEKRQESYSSGNSDHTVYANRVVTPEIKERVKAAIVKIQGTRPPQPQNRR
jgi:hypothetical protein